MDATIPKAALLRLKEEDTMLATVLLTRDSFSTSFRVAIFN